MAALGKIPSTSAERGLDRGICCDPVRKGVFAILDDTAYQLAIVMPVEAQSHVRFRRFISIICLSGLAWCYGCIVDEFQ